MVTAKTREVPARVAVVVPVVGAAAACYFTLFPFDFVLRRASLTETVGAFTLMTGFPLSPRELPANALLFLPLGAGVGAWVRGGHPGQRRRRPVLWAGLVGVLSSTVLELTQSAWLLRDPAVDDIVGNTVGALTGAAIALHLLERHRRRTHRQTAGGRRRTTLALVSLWTVLGVGGLICSVGETGLDRWDTSYPLVIGNEATGDVPWRGSIRYLAIADRTVSASERDAVLGGQALGDRSGPAVLLEQVFTGPRQVPAGWEARGAGGSSATAPPSVDDQGVALGSSFWLVRPDVRSVVQRLRAARAFTVAIEARADTVAQTGPARLVTLSIDTLHRDVAITQDGPDLVVRVRSDFSGPNGRFPEFVYPGVFVRPGWHRIVVSYDVEGITVGVDAPSGTRRLGLGPATVLAVESFPDRVQRIQLSGASAPTIAAFWVLCTFGPLAVWMGALGLRRRGWPSWRGLPLARSWRWCRRPTSSRPVGAGQGGHGRGHRRRVSGGAWAGSCPDRARSVQGGDVRGVPGRRLIAPRIRVLGQRLKRNLRWTTTSGKCRIVASPAATLLARGMPWRGG